MKRSSWVFKSFVTCAAVMIAGGQGAAQERPVDGDAPCMARSGETTEALEDKLTRSGKISENILAVIAEESPSTLDVVVVLNVPKPDLSALFGGKSAARDSASAGDRDASIDAAEQAVAEILGRTGGEELNRLRGAASVVARVSTDTLAELAASDFVAEIVENARLKD